MASAIRDITEHKRAEEALHESEEQFRLVANTAPVMIWMSGTDKLCTYVNTPWLDFTGRSLEAERGNGWTESIHPEDLQRSFDTYSQSFDRQDKFRMEYRLRRHDGEYRWILDNGVPRYSQEGTFAGYIGSCIDVTDSKRAEELLKIFVKNVPVEVAMFDCEMRYLQVSDRWCADYGVDASQVVGRLHYELVPDIPERWKQAHRLTLAGHTLRAEEDRWDRQGGAVTWIRWETRPWKMPSGAVGGILLFAENITHRKQMEEALSGVTGMLMEAQEKERARIARELHDDINQRLAMLTFGLDQLKVNPSDFESRVRELRKQTIELSSDVEALAHDLHSSKLEYLGVVAGMRSWCTEFGERQGLQIAFKHEVQSSIPSDIGLCLFRVLQEALHNAAKHSGVTRVEVHLYDESGEIHFTVSDLGKGFNSQAVPQGKGLGLTSMRERVRLAHGTITIESKPMGGTTIHVRVPLNR